MPKTRFRNPEIKDLAKSRRLLIDTDISLGTPGAEIDDGAALIVLLQAIPSAIAGVTTVFGNVPVSLATRNAGRLLSLLEHDRIPLHPGSARPLSAETTWLQKWYRRYGDTPLWAGEIGGQPAAAALIETVRAHPGEVTILALGPLTNLAQALQEAPEIENLVNEVVAMDGSFSSSANEPEFNFRCDPEAARAVLEAKWPLTLFGLDVTRRALFSRQDFGRLPDAHPALRLLKRQALPWIDTVEEMGWEKGGCSLHDAVAAVSLLDDTLFEFVEAEVQVEQAGRRGAVSIRPAGESGSSIRVATGVDVERCYDEIMRYLRDER